MATEYLFAADLGSTSISAAIVSSAGAILARKSEPLDSSSADASVAQLVRLANELSKKTGRRVRSAGVAVGVAAQAGGKAATPVFDEAELQAKLARALRLPAVVDSDRAAAVLGETWKGSAPGAQDVVVLLVGHNVLAGVMIAGHVLRGAHRLAGAAGWMAVSEADGFEVRKFGGLEAFASGPGIVRAAKNAIEAGFGGSLADYDSSLFTAEDIAELARRGDVTARQIYRRSGKQLGLAVANLVSLFDPAVVVVTGGLTGASDLFWADLLETATARAHPGAARQVQICLSKLHGDAVLLGAARLACELRSVAAKRPPIRRKRRAASRG